jgi:hypothetical protein
MTARRKVTSSTICIAGGHPENQAIRNECDFMQRYIARAGSTQELR